MVAELVTGSSTRGREKPRGKKGRATRDREREEGGGVQVPAPGASSVARAGSRRWHRWPIGTATQLLEVEDNGSFFRKPPGLVGFLGKTKLH
jgi:hypothetical protein